MKKTILLTLFVVLGLATKPQNVAAQDLNLGIKLGALTSQFAGEGAPSEISERVAFVGGLASELSFRDASEDWSRFTVAGDFWLARQGAEHSGTIQGEEIRVTTRLDYLQMSILPRFYFGLFGKVKSGFFVNAGPYGGLLVKANQSGTLSSGVEADVYAKADYNVPDYGFALGGGWGLAGIMSFEFRYNYGMADASALADSSPLHNRGWAFFFNLAFPLY